MLPMIRRALCAQHSHLAIPLTSRPTQNPVCGSAASLLERDVMQANTASLKENIQTTTLAVGILLADLSPIFGASLAGKVVSESRNLGSELHFKPLVT